MDKPGRVFYSGRRAFESPSELYVLGLNSSGDPEVEKETVYEHIEKINKYPEDLWSRYAEGEKKFHRKMEHLFQVLGRSPAEVPASNLVFLRSQRFREIPRDSRKKLINDCWAFHQAVIDDLKVRVIVCLATDSGNELRKIIRVDKEPIDCFKESYNKRKAKSFTFSNRKGVSVVQLTHPSYADWTSPAADPTRLVVRALEG